MNRLVEALQDSREQHRLLLVGFLPAGWPDRSRHEACVAAVMDGGVDALEIAVPSPPLPMDGPLLQQAAEVATREVGDAATALRLAAQARGHRRSAIIGLFYRHAVDELGVRGVIDTAVAADADALLMPEHTFAEQLEIAHQARAAGLEQVLFLFLEKDLELLADLDLDRPIIYMQSADLRTGDPFDGAKARERVGELRDALAGRDAAVLVGFGVRGTKEIAELADCSIDGVIVGTALTAAARRGHAPLADMVRGMLPALDRRPQASGV